MKTALFKTKTALQQLEREVESILLPLGYEVVALEQSSGPEGQKLILYIDFTEQLNQRVSLDDCIVVNKAVDSFFENTDLIVGHYTLEVSSPGIERPLRKTQDYERFKGKRIKLHTFRPLNDLEIENNQYWEKNKKQKNFIGSLQGLSKDQLKIKLTIDGELLNIPLDLITKAHLLYEENA